MEQPERAVSNAGRAAPVPDRSRADIIGAEALMELVEQLACVAEHRENTTGQHARRVGIISAALARGLGLSEELVERIRLAAPLHDVGKIRIPEHILLKPGTLTAGEFEIMKTHAAIGAGILSGGKLPLLRLAEEIALTHHERWDGRGYPRGLKGEAIPLSGRIVALADAFDALVSVRLYRKGRSIAEAVSEIKRHAGTQFDTRVVEAFLAHTPEPWTARLRIQTITR